MTVKETLNWSLFDYTKLQNVEVFTRKRRGHKRKTLNNIIIAADTETSKKKKGKLRDYGTDNHVCAWSICLTIEGLLYVLWGRKPSEMVKCFQLIQDNLQGEETLVYFHNLAYDYVFLRKFLYNVLGYPMNELATRPHYPISIEFLNGFTLRDSAIIAQRTLENWAKDLNVEHQKAVGKWDYEKIRNQDTPLDADEIQYFTFDVISLAECIDTYLKAIKVSLISIPYTATGLVRKEVQALANENNFKFKFNELALDLEQYEFVTGVYHGGLVHGNKVYITDKLQQQTITGDIYCYDFASSYPYCLIAEKYPVEKFRYVGTLTIEDVIKLADKYAVFGLLTLVNPCIKQTTELPIIQYSKCDVIKNSAEDNGRVIAADLVIMKTHEQRVLTISEDYDYDLAIMNNCYIARKGYLPKWLRDYIFSLYVAKCALKHGDPVDYAIAKARLNSVYGLHVQKILRSDISEIYETGEYETEDVDELSNEDKLEEYNKSMKSWGKVLPYQWGVWCTAYGERHLIELTRCCDDWLYGDTDSAFGRNWNEDKLNGYNEQTKQKLRDSGYDKVTINGEDFWLGIATLDKHFTEFRFTGAKRYCGRDAKSGKLIGTVAGVPKDIEKIVDGKTVKEYVASICLKDDISKFSPGFVFKGEQTGKKQHEYNYIDEIYIDEWGNETGDSIDLTPCDYKLDNATVDDLENYYSDYTIEEWSYTYG